MSKRNITYIKPEEPSFLRKLKEQAGYKEGPTIDTKKENLGPVADEDFQDTEEEQPIVVVLKSGDLTAEEAAQEQKRLDKEAEEAPADLNTRIIFKAPTKSKSTNEQSANKSDNSTKRQLESVARAKEKSSKKQKTSKKAPEKSLLSFDDEQDDDF